MLLLHSLTRKKCAISARKVQKNLIMRFTFRQPAFKLGEVRVLLQSGNRRPDLLQQLTQVELGSRRRYRRWGRRRWRIGASRAGLQVADVGDGGSQSFELQRFVFIGKLFSDRVTSSDFAGFSKFGFTPFFRLFLNFLKVKKRRETGFEAKCCLFYLFDSTCDCFM